MFKRHGILFFLLMFNFNSYAEDPPVALAPNAIPGSPSSEKEDIRNSFGEEEGDSQHEGYVPIEEDAQVAPKKAKSKGNLRREKEAEGTKAWDRFEADTVIKSHYSIDGQPLEVDPD